MISNARPATYNLVIPPLDLAARVYLGGVFIFAAWGKILDPYTFALSIATYQMMPTVLINVMAVVLPPLELVTGVLLILGIQTRVQAILINAMMVMFMVAIGAALYRNLDLGTCGCFASEEAAEEMSAATLWRDLWWLLIGIFIFCVNRGRWGLEQWRPSYVINHDGRQT
jgi:putative oxidoreductase